MSKLNNLLKALELLKETGYHKGVLQQKKRRPVGEGAPSTYEKKPVKGVKNPSKKFQQQAAGVTGAKLVGGETVHSDDGKNFYSIKPSSAVTSRGRHIVTSAGKERKKPVFGLKKATKDLEDVMDKLKKKQRKRKIQAALDDMKKKVKKSGTQRLLEQLKSDVEQGVYGNVAGRPTNGVSTDTPIDAPNDYEGQSHDGIRSEQFKYEDKKPKVDDDHKNKAGEFVYSEHVPYKTKSLGAVGIPLTQENTWGMKYATKEEVDEYLSKQNVLNKIEQPKGESISFGDDYKPHKTVRERSSNVGQSKLSEEDQNKVEAISAKYARGKEYGKQQQAKRKEPGKVTADTKFIADDGSVHTTEAARNTRNTAYGQVSGKDKPPKMHGDN